MNYRITNLAVNNNRSIDIGAQKSFADGVEILLFGGGRVTHWDAVVSQFGVLGLHIFHYLRAQDRVEIKKNPLKSMPLILLQYIHTVYKSMGKENFDLYFKLQF